MTWRAVHPSLTQEVRVPDDDPSAPTFTIGFWPPLEAEKAKLYVSSLRRTQALGDAESGEVILRKARVDLHAFRDMARFGIRGWSGLGDLACATEKIEIDGRLSIALTEESCDILYHGGLLLPVALACWRFNNLTEAEKKTSRSPSNSPFSMSGTPAIDVMPPSPTGKREAESFGSTGVSSTGARTS